eukprot:scaffold1929_cov357-Pinguiococcus_pyrenoidosus.AAC.2
MPLAYKSRPFHTAIAMAKDLTWHVRASFLKAHLLYLFIGLHTEVLEALVNRALDGIQAWEAVVLDAVLLANLLQDRGDLVQQLRTHAGKHVMLDLVVDTVGQDALQMVGLHACGRLDLHLVPVVVLFHGGLENDVFAEMLREQSIDHDGGLHAEREALCEEGPS